MVKQRFLWFLPVLLFLLTNIVSASVSVEVYSMEEALHETNISKPRVFIKNTGQEAVSNFKVYYYFTVATGKTPTVQGWWIPNSSLSMENLGDNNYRICYDYSGFTLEPGASVPGENNGSSVGINYVDWSGYNKENDLSNNLSSSYATNYNIHVYSESGERIFGGEISDPDYIHYDYQRTSNRTHQNLIRAINEMDNDNKGGSQ